MVPVVQLVHIQELIVRRPGLSPRPSLECFVRIDLEHCQQDRNNKQLNTHFKPLEPQTPN